MDKEILKSTLFGYSKISVCQYIATMNEEFNAKLMAEEASFREERTNLQKKIDELEMEEWEKFSYENCETQVKK